MFSYRFPGVDYLRSPPSFNLSFPLYRFVFTWFFFVVLAFSLLNFHFFGSLAFTPPPSFLPLPLSHSSFPLSVSRSLIRLFLVLLHFGFHFLSLGCVLRVRACVCVLSSLCAVVL